MPKKDWRTRKRGTPRQVGKKFMLQPSSQKLKEKLPTVKGTTKGEKARTLKYWTVEILSPWQGYTDKPMTENVTVPARGKRHAIAIVKAQGKKPTGKVTFAHKETWANKRIDKITKKVKVVERIDKDEYVYYRWDNNSWLMVRDDYEVGYFHVKGVAKDVPRFAKSLQKIADDREYEAVYIEGGDKKLAKKVEKYLIEELNF